jgi:type IV secretion system protein VirD4
MSFLGLYRDPTVAEVTSACDWRIADLIDAHKPVSLYLVVPPSDISRTKPLVRLILNQIGRRLTEKLDGQIDGDRRRQVLLMLDEFPALGRLDFFESALAFMAGYGLRAFLIAQSLNQIEKAYGPNNSILDNCHVRVAFATNDERTAKRISDALGTKTEMRAMRNYAGHRLAPWLAHVMVSRQETARQLLTPGEVMQLPADDEVVLVSGLPPIRAKKLRYFEDANFTGRVGAPASTGDRGTPYADRPPSRKEDWGTRRRAVDERLVRSSFGNGHEADDGGKDLKPEIDAPAQSDIDAAEQDRADTPASDSDEVAIKRAADLARATDTARRAYGVDKGTPKIDLMDF